MIPILTKLMPVTRIAMETMLKNISALMRCRIFSPNHRPANVGIQANSAKKVATKQKRLTQMLDELKQGDVYMKMAWKK